VDTDEEFVYKALELWKGEYPSHVRLNCVKVASKFDKKFYLEKWLKLLSYFTENRPISPNCLQKQE